jgi:FkbM family methyltransferase
MRLRIKKVTLSDGTSISAILASEAIVLDDHVEGYFDHGITIQDGDTIFDVGANVGIFGVRALQKGDHIKVFAFEPIPTIFVCLEQNAKDFGTDRFVPLNCGLSSSNGEMTFTYYPNSPALSTSKPQNWTQQELNDAVEGSLKNPPKNMWYIKYLPSFVAHIFAKRMRNRSQEYTCQLRTISDIIAEYDIEQIALLKIDCEGAEFDCLEGIHKEDWNKINQVVIEVHDKENAVAKVKSYLEKMGLTKQIVEQERALTNTSLYNIYARR